jgi:hypothetical protein
VQARLEYGSSPSDITHSPRLPRLMILLYCNVPKYCHKNRFTMMRRTPQNQKGPPTFSPIIIIIIKSFRALKLGI